MSRSAGRATAGQRSAPAELEAPELRVRPALAEDLPAIVRLQAACFPTPLPAGHLRRELLENRLADFLVAQGVVEARRASAEPGPFAEERVASMDGAGPVTALPLVGYVSVWWLFDEAHVSAIAVAPEWRRRGVARRMMTVLRDEALRRDMVALTLEVRRGNHAARRLYEGLGLEPVGLRRAYYADTGEDAVIMTARLR